MLLQRQFPNCAPEDVRGLVVTGQGRRGPTGCRIEKRNDGRGFPYFWIGFERSKMKPEEGTDLQPSAAGRFRSRRCRST